MNVEELIRCIPAMYNSRRPVMLWGPPGIGKSFAFRTVAKQLAHTLGLAGPIIERHQLHDYDGDIKQAFGMFDLRLSQCDPVDVGGLPKDRNGVMARLLPDWFPAADRTDIPEHGILLLDELPSAPLSVQTSAYQIALDGVIGDRRMKKGWYVAAAGNRLTDGGQFFKMPMALANRFCHLDVESNVDSWTNWAIDSNIEHSLVAFIRFRQDLLNTYEEHVTKKLKGMAFATERQWHAVADLIECNSNAKAELLLDKGVLAQLVGGLVGDGPGAEYLAFRDVWQKMPSIDGIFLDPNNSIVPDDSATLYAVMTAVGARATYDNMTQAMAYIDKVGAQGRPEFGVMALMDIQRRSMAAQIKGDASWKNPMTSPAFAQWAAKNTCLLNG